MLQLISDTPWDEQALMDQVAKDANGPLGGHRHSALHLTYISTESKSLRKSWSAKTGREPSLTK